MTKPALSDYIPVVGKDTIDELYTLSKQVRGAMVQHVNSTAVGGGVAEILTRMVPLFNELNIQTTWDVIKGGQDFYNVTKAFHNALHGRGNHITEEMFEIFREYTRMNLQSAKFTGGNIFIHDPQPAGLVAARERIGRNWVWRCHIDVSSPDMAVWQFLKPYVEQYDVSIFSMPEFAQRLPIPQYMIPPSIDPLSDKNKEIDETVSEKVLEKYQIDASRPILTQVSRFDRLKDPVGVIKAYKIVKKRDDCQLVLAGGFADDDPEGAEVFSEVKALAEKDPDIHLLVLPPYSDLEINALQRASTLVIQKSLKEGFGLTVTEALWKGKPVVAGAVGGIKLQILNGVTGFLVRSVEGCAHAIRQILNNLELGVKLGQNGREHVKNNFLITRDVKDHLLILLALRYRKEDIVTLR